MKVDSHVRSRLHDWVKTRGAFVAPYTRPLFGVNERDQPKLVGSCVLAQIAGRRLLLTAAHVCKILLVVPRQVLQLRVRRDRRVGVVFR